MNRCKCKSPKQATCGSCGRSWCYQCDPGPSALCPYCNGYGYSTAPLTRTGRKKTHSPSTRKSKSS